MSSSEENPEKFNEEEFDQKVATTITDIHYQNRRNIKEKKFEAWYLDNREHLTNMYGLSGLFGPSELSELSGLNFDMFCTYVFDNS